MKTKKHLSFTSLRKSLSENFRTVPEYRQLSKVSIPLHDAIMSGLACMYFQSPSLLEFQKRLENQYRTNNLKTLFDVRKIPKETEMREILDEIDSENFRPCFKDIYTRLQRGKQLERYQILPNLYYFPIDGSGFFSSSKISCSQCLRSEHKSEIIYSHKVLQGGIMHPDCCQIIPFMPEQIVNSDGTNKQDCERNAAKRLVKHLKHDFPRLGFLIGGDDLFSKQPMIEDVLAAGMHYLFVVKPGDHKYLFEWLKAYPQLHEFSWKENDKEETLHEYRWMNQVPLHGSDKAIQVNFLRYQISRIKKGERKIVYYNSWVTDLEISEKNVKALARAGRCRWKSENECFNVMKNQGYFMEHNYGHGKKYLAYNFYLLTLLAFLFHQILEFTDEQYLALRNKGSKQLCWERLRVCIEFIVFDNWLHLVAFMLAPDKRPHEGILAQPPPLIV